MPDSTAKLRKILTGMAPLAALYFLIVYVLPKPEELKPEAWRLFAVFAATVLGLMTQPIAGGGLVLIAVTMSAVVGGLTLTQSLSGYADPTVWLVLGAFFISRSLINTGLARRIALFFLRSFGRTSLGVTYALSASDLLLAGIIPSNGARSGGVVLPIVRSIAELYGSTPGPTAGRIGSFLMVTVYQSICITSAMFFTGQASNPLAAKMAGNAGYTVTWTSWFLAGLVPGFLSLAVIPLVIRKLYPPEVMETPEAAEFARAELKKMGPLSLNEWILSAVFIVVCGFWVASDAMKLEIAIPALLGSAALLVTGVLTWEDVKNEKAAWDIFVWYGGLVRLGKALNEAHVTEWFAKAVGNAFGDFGWAPLFAIALLIYFYAHYVYASITAHLLSMFPPFLAVLTAKGAPIGLMVYSFACFACFSAGLTNYGSTPTPMFFAHDYVPMRTWWKIGFVISLVNLTIWSTAGFAWWKVLGFW